MKRKKKRFGFTMTELIIVIAIIAVLAAIGVPSLFSFVEAGRQANRTNIARTLYLAAQNQLSELRVTRSLDGFVHDAGLDPDEPSTLVYNLLGRPDDWPDTGNEDNVHFLSKPSGYTLGGGNAGADMVLRLLYPVVVSREILDDAILIEFNIRTGVVLSVFYGDRGNNEFVYNEAAGNSNIIGARGMDGYAPVARERRQGFYGVSNTNGLPEDVEPMLINIYDGYDDAPRRPVDMLSENTLFARMWIPGEFEGDDFRASLHDSAGNIVSDVSFSLALLGTTFNGAIADSSHLIRNST